MFQNKNNMFFKGLIVILFICLSIGLILYKDYSYKVIGAFRPMIRVAENKIILYRTDSFKEIETDNFIIRYEDIDEEILDLIIDTAEDKYGQIAPLFKYERDEKVLMVVYNNYDSFVETAMLGKGNPPMGAYYGDSIHIANPELWVKGKENLEHSFYYEGPILHELVHLFTDHEGGGNFPIWFTEGISLYFEYMIDGYEWGFELAPEEVDFTMDELTNNFNNLDAYKAYTRSFRLVKAFVDDHGFGKLMTVIDSLGRGVRLDEFIK